MVRHDGSMGGMKSLGGGMWWAWGVALAGWLWSAPLLADSFELELESGAVLSVERFGSGGDRILWLPSEYGIGGEIERELVRAVAGEGVEVWLADLHGSYFLAPGRSSLGDVPREDIRDLITAARPLQGRLYLLSYGRGAALALEAARLWQLAAARDATPLGGALLLHPNLAAGTPQAGERVEFAPIATGSNLPIFLFQPMNSAKRWYLEELVARLGQGGSDVFSRPLADVSDGFQVRDDATRYEREVRQRLPLMFRTALRLLASYNGERRQPVVELGEAPAEPSSGVAAELQPIEGRPPAPMLQLSDIAGKSWSLQALRGEVVLLNFWATWCPPCVEEIPSLGRLNARLTGKGFRVVSVDVGEEAAQVREFLHKVPAQFPVLLDPQGTTTAPWKLRAFPTSFLIDREGRLRYGYFGGLEWDAPEVIDLITMLLQEG
ncbi:MAG: TlpA family protein disulfide reductase [Gammaproteobacteria bacterium]|nr:TlpA family protein disulfide reductase [Gammaproteobacteria bacterium]